MDRKTSQGVWVCWVCVWEQRLGLLIDRMGKSNGSTQEAVEQPREGREVEVGGARR